VPGALPLGGGFSPGGAPPGAVLGGVAFGALEVPFGAALSGALLADEALWSEGPPGSVDCCFAQPAASMSAAMDRKTELRFIRTTSL